MKMRKYLALLLVFAFAFSLVTVKAGKTQKTTWMKVKVTKSSSTDENTTTEQSETPNPIVDRKSIVVYFSCTDNTKTIVGYSKTGILM